MKNIWAFFLSSLGQKMVAGLTGLGLCFFILFHMSGNLLLLQGAESYNTFAQQLHQNIAFEILEKGLFLFFGLHIVLASLLSVKNWRAKRGSYFKKAQGEKRLDFSHQILLFQAVVLLVFLGNHLLTFKWGAHYVISYEGEEMRDLYRLAFEVFQRPEYVLGYAFSILLLFFHFGRGFSASLKSLGFSHPQYNLLLEKMSWVLSWIVLFGFLSPVVYIYITQKGWWS